jgi:SAM-dependent methyltransferase
MADPEESGRYWDVANVQPREDVRYWLGVLEIRRSVNVLLTGDPDKLFIQQFLERFRSRWPLGKALSVGCGAGELERGALGLGAFDRAEGIDVSEGSLELARKLADDASVGDRVRYEKVAALSGMRHRREDGARYDVLFFHGILHHVEDLEDVLECAGELVRGGDPGLVYVDEYVGPSRNEWTEEHLGFAAGLFSRVRHEHRRTPHVWPPIAMDDPTEMIRSADIPRLVRQHLDVVEEHPYYGDVLAPLVCAIRGSALEVPEVRTVWREAVELERHLASRGLLESLYRIFVARPRTRMTSAPIRTP